MNAKILSILFILFLGAGFSSYSKDDNAGNYDSGKSQGEQFRNELNAYDSNNLLSVQTVTAGANLLNIYSQYKKNSSDSEWKKGFLEGATNFDTTKYDGLTKLLDQGFSLNSVMSLLELLNKK